MGAFSRFALIFSSSAFDPWTYKHAINVQNKVFAELLSLFPNSIYSIFTNTCIIFENFSNGSSSISRLFGFFTEVKSSISLRFFEIVDFHRNIFRGFLEVV